MRKLNVSCAVRATRVYTMIRKFIAVTILACVLAQIKAAVDVPNPGGSVQVNKEASPSAVAPVVSSADVDPSGATSSPAALAPGTHMTRAERRRLRKDMRQKSSGNVDVTYPFGGVIVRRAGEDGPRNVNVVYPGGSVNVGGNGRAGDGSKPAVNVEYPGGYVRLDPKQPGERRKGVIEFPFGRVVLS